MRPNRKFYNSRSYELLDDIGDSLKNIIIEGQEKNIFLTNLDVNLFKTCILGTIDHIIIPWVIFNRQYSLTEVGEEISELLVNAILKEADS